jgi:hypothetical protein
VAGIDLAPRPFSKKGGVEVELHLAPRPWGEVMSRRWHLVYPGGFVRTTLLSRKFNIGDPR